LGLLPLSKYGRNAASWANSYLSGICAGWPQRKGRREAARPSSQEGLFHDFRDDMGDHPITSGDWALYEIRAPIAEDAYHMEFGVQLVGQGATWIDQISMEYAPAP
jgi:hypothetical protein